MRRAWAARRASLASVALVSALGLGVALGACKKSEVTPEELDARARAANANASASAAPAEAGADAAAAKSVTYAGRYTVAVAKMYVPEQKDWSSVKFKNDETKMLGGGELTLTVDSSGRVSGTAEQGPLGAAILDGSSDGTTLTATVRRKDPSDEGLTGTLVAKISGDALEGTMKLAEANAAVVREAKVEAKKK